MKFNLDNLVAEFYELEQKFWDTEIFKDQKKIRDIANRKKQIEEAVILYKKYKDLNNSLEDNKKMLKEEKDDEMKELEKREIKEIESKIIDFEEKLKIALLPKDLNDDKNIIVEVRAWTGWDEAALFAGEISRAYLTFAEEEGFKTEITEKTENETGWIKEIIFEVRWKWAHSKFKYESWIHRVQRIPETENKWRVHTSAITVAIMPEVDNIDIEIKDEDIEMQFTGSGWPGWQHANKADSAVHLKHIPTWIAVFCSEWRSQHRNRDKAFKILRAKLYTYKQEKIAKKLWEKRLSQVWSWDRSEKIRTYNFPQDRVTDHRVWKNFSWITQIMMWKIWHIVDTCAVFDQQKKLEEAWKSNKVLE